MAEEEGKTKNRISIFERLNQKYGREEVNKRLGAVEGVPSGNFYRFEIDEKVLVKKHPDAIYSPDRFKFSDDGWGYVGNLQRWEEVQSSKETGEPALVYPFGLSESQLWELLGNIKGIFPKWSPDVDEKLEILDGLLLDVSISRFQVNGQDRKKVRISIENHGDGRDGYKDRLEWLRSGLVPSAPESTDTSATPVITTPEIAAGATVATSEAKNEELKF